MAMIRSTPHNPAGGSGPAAQYTGKSSETNLSTRPITRIQVGCFGKRSACSFLLACPLEHERQMIMGFGHVRLQPYGKPKLLNGSLVVALLSIGDSEIVVTRRVTVI